MTKQLDAAQINATINAADAADAARLETGPHHSALPEDFISPQAIRWHLRFLEAAALVSTWSKDPSTRVGAVIVDDERRIVSTGYNGLPRDMPDLPEFLEDRTYKYPMTIHAEHNAVLTARERDLRNCTLYATHAPCSGCTAAAIQAGVRRFVCLKPTGEYLERWREDLKFSKILQKNTGSHILQLDSSASPIVEWILTDRSPTLSPQKIPDPGIEIAEEADESLITAAPDLMGNHSSALSEIDRLREEALQLRHALKRCADGLERLLTARYPVSDRIHPMVARRHQRGIAPVLAARNLLAKEEP